MDGVVLALDRLVAPFHAKARRFEAGAAWAAPVLGTLAVAVFFLLAGRWLDAQRIDKTGDSERAQHRRQQLAEGAVPVPRNGRLRRTWAAHFRPSR